jgi:hypothetical protein
MCCYGYRWVVRTTVTAAGSGTVASTAHASRQETTSPGPRQWRRSIPDGTGPHKRAKQPNDMVAGLHGPKLSVGYGAPTWGRLQEVSKLTWPERTANIHRGRGSSPWDRPSCRREGKRGSPSRATCARHVPMVWSCQVSSAGQRGGTPSPCSH